MTLQNFHGERLAYFSLLGITISLNWEDDEWSQYANKTQLGRKRNDSIAGLSKIQVQVQYVLQGYQLD